MLTTGRGLFPSASGALVCHGLRPGAVLRRLASAAAPRVSALEGGQMAEDGEGPAPPLTPTDVVAKLDEYIVGQPEAKRAVAIALRNRWRRQNLPDDLQKEVIPKNILMIGPTGCGKTEIARRISSLSQAPFIKVEATKFTEVGFHGRDVDQIIRDLVESAMSLVRQQHADKLRQRVKRMAEDRILDTLTGPHSQNFRESFRQLLQDGALDERKIEVEITKQPGFDKGGNVLQVDSGSTFPEILGKMQKMAGRRTSEKKKLPISEARPIIEEQELEKLMENLDIKKAAIAAVEQSGIVFIDEIDKICSPSGKYRGADASAEGVQRDLLPLIEGSTINTKYGNVQTDYILFVASGAFHHVKPSDLLAELQGRLPIRVELKGLTEGDMYRILTEPITNLLAQQVELMQAEGIELEFEEGAVREMARVATEANRLLENIGARRLHTIVERVMEDISFEAPDMEETRVVVTKELVEERVSSLLVKSDLSKYIL
eukprot:CAMPEP_0118974440 /NCGR_PEP_ID=MMETSP1173-20130426/11583_1 /TAXON_ID=1034831 /ORGANISM="Rhizochromulina marina cf, Strain CCMP1243" /LENGTH=488 /DNA_ID=CAMNT_0006924175 /DNA_START=78 /DNA_END=1544 /DNA_ORIENTATION=-